MCPKACNHHNTQLLWFYEELVACNTGFTASFYVQMHIYGPHFFLKSNKSLKISVTNVLQLNILKNQWHLSSWQAFKSPNHSLRSSQEKYAFYEELCHAGKLWQRSCTVEMHALMLGHSLQAIEYSGVTDFLGHATTTINYKPIYFSIPKIKKM